MIQCSLFKYDLDFVFVVFLLFPSQGNAPIESKKRSNTQKFFTARAIWSIRGVVTYDLYAFRCNHWNCQNQWKRIHYRHNNIYFRIANWSHSITLIIIMNLKYQMQRIFSGAHLPASKLSIFWEHQISVFFFCVCECACVITGSVISLSL